MTILVKPFTHLGVQNRGQEPFSPQQVSVDFNGTDEKMRNTAGQLINVGDVFSWSMWVKPRAGAFANNSRMFTFRPAADFRDACWFDLNGGDANDPVQIDMYDSSITLFKSYTWDNLFTQDAWGLITVTWSGSSLLLYFDGSLVGPTTNAPDLSNHRADASNHVIIVGSNNAGPLEMDCLIHSTALWSTVLTANEHVALYNGGAGSIVNWGIDSGDYVSSGSMQHWWRLGAVASDMGKDSGVQRGQGNINVGDNAVNITTANIVADYPGI